jgi:hypothetical protein
MTSSLQLTSNGVFPQQFHSPGALIPYDMIGSDVLRDSLMRLGSWVAENGINGPGAKLQVAFSVRHHD